jgi:glycine/D-amino acid oxidase-like deaminating enzyme
VAASLEVRDESEVRDLRTGLTIWQHRNPRRFPAVDHLPHDVTVDVVIVGCGISGAFLAERLSRAGARIAAVDRRGPQQGSTGASTSLLQWELDAPMVALEPRLGFVSAARTYRRCIAAVRGIAALVGALGIACGFRRQHSLYLAGSELDGTGLREELRLRRAAGIGGRYLTGDELSATMHVAAAAALRSGGSAEADPVALANGLLAAARSRGALIVAPVAATAYDSRPGGVSVITDRGSAIHARSLVLATGYEMPSFVPSSIHRVVSTWAVATTPLAERNVPAGGDLVWEASRPYLYARSTADNRVIAGGEDEPISDDHARDALIEAKTARIMARITAVFPSMGGIAPDYRWSGFFGETVDGLPLIGRVPGMPNCYAAFGYGGNGIANSYIAADLLGRLMTGRRDPDEDVLAIDRDAS